MDILEKLDSEKKQQQDDHGRSILALDGATEEIKRLRAREAWLVGQIMAVQKITDEFGIIGMVGSVAWRHQMRKRLVHTGNEVDSSEKAQALTGTAPSVPEQGTAMRTDFLAVLGNKKAIRRQCAERVKAAFDGIDWRKQSFSVTGVGMLEADGEKNFYKAGEIDAAVQRLNEVLSDFSK